MGNPSDACNMIGITYTPKSKAGLLTCFEKDLVLHIDVNLNHMFGEAHKGKQNDPKGVSRLQVEFQRQFKVNSRAALYEKDDAKLQPCNALGSCTGPTPRKLKEVLDHSQNTRRSLIPVLLGEGPWG